MVDQVSGSGLARTLAQLAGGKPRIDRNATADGAVATASAFSAAPASAAVASADSAAAGVRGARTSFAADFAAELAAAPPVDSARVEALRSAIAQGRYALDPERIATAMIRAERG